MSGLTATSVTCYCQSPNNAICAFGLREKRSKKIEHRPITGLDPASREKGQMLISNQLCPKEIFERDSAPAAGQISLTIAQILVTKIEWLVTNVTPVGSPDRAKVDILVMILGVFVVNSGCFCDRGSTL